MHRRHNVPPAARSGLLAARCRNSSSSRLPLLFHLLLLVGVAVFVLCCTTTVTASATSTIKKEANQQAATTTTSATTMETNHNHHRSRTTTATQQSVVDIEKILNEIGVEGQIGQMALIDVNMLLNDDKTQLDDDKVKHYIGEMGIGNVLNNIQIDDRVTNDKTVWSIRDFRRAMIQLNDVARQYNHPPILWGLDSVHGANYLYDTIISPQPINIACTFNTTVSYYFGKIASRDTRRAGITWLYSPLLGLSWNPYWSRVYETFGEDPLVVGDMAQSMIVGIQEPDKNDILPSRAAACAKHYLGYSFPHNGHDRSPSWIPTRHLYQYFMLPWKKVLPGHDNGGSSSSGTLSSTSNNNNNNNNQDNEDDYSHPMTIMESYTETDGVPMVANHDTLYRMLRNELNFHGMLVTDYHEIFNLYEWHHTATSRSNAIHQAIVEGTVDMSMIAKEPDDFISGMHDLLSSTTTVDGINNRMIQQRIRSSARRVLQLKKDLRMFDESFRMEEDDPYHDHDDNNGGRRMDHDSTPEDATTSSTTTTTTSSKTSISSNDLKESLDATYQSIVLTKNDHDTLPLSHGNGNGDNNNNNVDSLRILVTGPTCNSKSFQTGGWTGQWQGVDSRIEDKWFTYGETVRSALKNRQDRFQWTVSYSCGVSIMGDDCSDDDGSGDGNDSKGVLDSVKDWVGWNAEDVGSIQKAKKAFENNDVAVVCLGEESNTEKPGDERSIYLRPGQYALVDELAEVASTSPNKRIILVYFGGRPKLLRDIVPKVDAVFVGLLAGPQAGTAIADFMAGEDINGSPVQPSGRLSLTWPLYEDLGGVPYLHSVSDQCTEDTGGVLPHWGYEQCAVQWEFGRGLSYSSFSYSAFSVSTNTLRQRWNAINHDNALTVSVNVRNEGTMAGSHSVLFFSFDEFRSVTPEYKRLRAYTKIWLEPSQEMTVTLPIPLNDFRFVGPHDDRHYVLQDGLVFRIGVDGTDCRTDPDSEFCATVTVETEEDYVGACEAACNLWDESGCHSMSGCRSKCYSIHDDPSSSLNNDGWGWGYVDCLEGVIWNDSFDPRTDCSKLTLLCRNIFATSSVDEYGTGSGSTSMKSTEISPVALVLSLFAGIFVSVMIIRAMNGGCSSPRKTQDKGDIQFSAISTSEGEFS